ncbi:hypothetical protein AURDEDRAFT_178516 [Auricularia subglabra TFB-10046 SS5]|uniref:Uncharacterized protein n=1 Tax=Auricularia subglabra (strain TFB-10046 / SS5) TaxID=717982 RepID=J0CQC9_AURST|nr:hypothetical protein AURDEDRAFT_178516 [Auricularia subglabra TFB-10046 SS5]
MGLRDLLDVWSAVSRSTVAALPALAIATIDFGRAGESDYNYHVSQLMRRAAKPPIDAPALQRVTFIMKPTIYKLPVAAIVDRILRAFRAPPLSDVVIHAGEPTAFVREHMAILRDVAERLMIKDHKGGFISVFELNGGLDAAWISRDLHFRYELGLVCICSYSTASAPYDRQF